MKISKDAQAVIVRKEDSGKLSFLLIKRFDKDKQEDHYRLVKGGVEQGETSKHAAQREVFEEVGIKRVDNTELLNRYEYVVGDVRHEVEVFLLIVKDLNENLSPNSSNEGGFTIKEVVWLSKDEAVGVLNFADEKKMIEKAAERLLTV